MIKIMEIMNYFRKHFKFGRFFKTQEVDNTQVVEESVTSTLEGKCEDCECVDTKKCEEVKPMEDKVEEVVEEKVVKKTTKKSTPKKTTTKKTISKGKKTDL
jgi:hypothetical protein